MIPYSWRTIPKQIYPSIISSNDVYLCQNLSQVAGGLQLSRCPLYTIVLHVAPMVDHHTHEGTQYTGAPQDGGWIC